MKIRTRIVFRGAALALTLLVAAGIAAPYVSAEQFGRRLRGSLERALGRRVEFRGQVRFSLFKGPGFAVDSVVIHEDPAIGLEPVAYVDSLEVRPELLALARGRFVIASVRLDGASINLAKSGPAAEPGRWNFVPLVDPAAMGAGPAIHVRNSRINFRFGETKSVFYLMETDLDVAPPGSGQAGWTVACSAKPARTDRTAQGLGSFSVQGRWFRAPERVDLDARLDRTGLDELTALWRGQAGNVHGTISARLHLGGPVNNIGVEGNLNIEDVHRWDLLPPQGQGWPLDVRGRLNLPAQQLELSSSPPGGAALPPVWVRFRVGDYLSKPHWAVTVNWDRFPVAPFVDLARHMGAAIPPRLGLSGTMDGAIGYSDAESFQGQVGFHDAALAIPDSPPLRFDGAFVVVDHGRARLQSTLARTAGGDAARLEADYGVDDGTLALSISAEDMHVESLRAQVALAAVPWLEQVRSGRWSGTLHYHRSAAEAGWTGDLALTAAQVPVSGLEQPVELASAHARIDGTRLALDHITASTGKVRFTGEYRYEPGATRPHRARLRALTVDAIELEAALLPTLRHSPGLIARALGRGTVPEWLGDRHADISVEIADLLLAGEHLRNLRGRLLWDGARATIDALQARLDGAAISGALAVNLRGARPAYRFTGKIAGLGWEAGKLDAEGVLTTSGTGAQLLAGLAAEGTFSGAAVDLGAPATLRSLSGAFSLTWARPAPRWRFTNVNAHIEDETYTGSGGTQDDGRLLVVLTGPSREMRLSGPLARVRVEDAAHP